MTTDPLAAAIDHIRSITPGDNPWTADDVSSFNPWEPDESDYAIATILNAVVSGQLINRASRDEMLAQVLRGEGFATAGAEAALHRVVDATVPETLTDAQINDACMSYRHDFGLLEDDDREIVKFQCREWWRSIRRALKRPEARP